MEYKDSGEYNPLAREASGYQSVYIERYNHVNLEVILDTNLLNFIRELRAFDEEWIEE